MAQTELVYQLHGDKMRRALIRYYPSLTQMCAEYLPQLINAKILPHLFSSKQVHQALTDIGKKCSRRGIYYVLADPFNPIIAPVTPTTSIIHSTVYKDDPSLSQHPSNPPHTNSKTRMYFLRPKHEIHAMILDNAYFREFELGHRHIIPPASVFADTLPPHQMDMLRKLYKKIEWTAPKKKLKWERFLNYFTDIDNDDHRTVLDESRITTPNTLKVAFFEALIKPGEYTTTDICLMTGIHHENLRHVIRKSNIARERRYIVVHADSYWEAKQLADKRDFLLKLNDGKYMIQKPSHYRLKNNEDPAPHPAKDY